MFVPFLMSLDVPSSFDGTTATPEELALDLTVQTAEVGVIPSDDSTHDRR